MQDEETSHQETPPLFQLGSKHPHVIPTIAPTASFAVTPDKQAYMPTFVVLCTIYVCGTWTGL